MKSLRIPGIARIYRVNTPEEIGTLAQDPRINRQFEPRTCPFNGLLLKRSLAVLSFRGRLFPTMIERDSPERKLRQQELAQSLHARSAAVRLGPDQLVPLARWVRGEGTESAVGPLTQQLLGRLFVPDFLSTAETWSAAQVLVAAPRSRNLFQVLWWFVGGRLRRSKALLAQQVGGDLSAVNAIGIAVHNVVKGIRAMRMLYSDPGLRSSLAPTDAAHRCLFAPVSLYRQATAAGQLGACPFPRHALFVLEIGKASQQAGGRSLVFMDGTWSRCPATDWVPAMMEGLWTRSVGAAAADPH